VDSWFVVIDFEKSFISHGSERVKDGGSLCTAIFAKAMTMVKKQILARVIGM